MSEKVCSNCSITESYAWRKAKDLGVLLCNACHNCWTRKGHHRAVCSTEERRRREAEIREKKAAKAQVAIQIGAHSSNASWGPVLVGKRKRVAKDFGEDQECYGEGLLGRSDSSDSMEWEGVEKILPALNGLASTPAEMEMSMRKAAEVLVSLKRAKHAHEAVLEVVPLPAARTARRTATKRARSQESTIPNEEQQKPSKRGKAAEKHAKDQSCKRCGQTKTPMWRKIQGDYPYCNACGLAANSAARATTKPSKVVATPATGGPHSPVVPAAPAVSGLLPVAPLTMPAPFPRALTIPMPVDLPALRCEAPALSPCRGEAFLAGPPQPCAM